MAQIQPPILEILKKNLETRFVPHLPPLAGNGSELERRSKQISRAFNAFVLQSRFGLSDKLAGAMVVDDFNDNGIDAIYYHKDDETLYFLQTKLRATEQFGQPEAQAFIAGIRLVINQDFDTFNVNVQNRINDIVDALDDCNKIQLIISYVGSGISQHAIDTINQFVNSHELDEGRISADVIYISADDVEEILRSEQTSQKINTKIKFHKSGLVTQPRATVFGLVKLDDLITLHKTHGKSLYEKNIRYFIGAGRRGVNKAIKSTLEKNPQNFFYLNNGVTAVCTAVEERRAKDGFKDYKITGLSIINGAQTIASSSQFKDENPGADISTARVMVTLIQASEEGEFHKQVTRSRNLQNPVDIMDFAALDDLQEKLRQEIALYGIQYQYRPEAQVQSGLPVIEIVELTKALACLASDIRYAARLKSEPSQFFDTDGEAYKGIYSNDLTGSAAINAVRIYRVILENLKAAENSSQSPEKLVYRHCGYAIASILIKRFKSRIYGDHILDENSIKQLISVNFDELRQHFYDQYQVESNGFVPHSFFKRVGETARLINRVMIVSQNMSTDPAVLHLQARYDVDDQYNQSLTNFLTGRLTQI